MTSNGFIPCFSHWKRNCPVPVISPIAPVACRGRSVASIFSWNRVRPAATQAVALDRSSRHTCPQGRIWSNALEAALSAQRSRAFRWRQSSRIDLRLIAGTALIERDAIDGDSWDDRRGSAPPDVRERELSLERAVSQVIGNMPFLWLSVDDEPGPQSLRGFIERNAIALLSNYGKPPIDPPSGSWLGSYCTRGKGANIGPVELKPCRRKLRSSIPRHAGIPD